MGTGVEAADSELRRFKRAISPFLSSYHKLQVPTFHRYDFEGGDLAEDDCAMKSIKLSSLSRFLNNLKHYL